MRTQTPEKERAAAPTTAQTMEPHDGSYRDHAPVSTRNLRQQQIKERRAAMPRSCQASYDRAQSGRSRKAAVHAFCLECCGYEVREVFACQDAGCPLWPYRPRSRIAQGASEGVREHAESAKSATGKLWGGA